MQKPYTPIFWLSFGSIKFCTLNICILDNLKLIGEDRGLLGVSPTLVNLVEDHEFISEKYYLHWYEAFWGKPKAKP